MGQHLAFNVLYIVTVIVRLECVAVTREKIALFIGVGRFRILGGPKFRILGGQGGVKFPAGT